MRKLNKNFHSFQIQKRIVVAETICGNTVVLSSCERSLWMPPYYCWLQHKSPRISHLEVVSEFSQWVEIFAEESISFSCTCVFMIIIKHSYCKTIWKLWNSKGIEGSFRKDFHQFWNYELFFLKFKTVSEYLVRL